MCRHTWWAIGSAVQATISGSGWHIIIHRFSSAVWLDYLYGILQDIHVGIFGLWKWSWDVYICVYYIFWEIIQVLRRGVRIFENGNVFENLYFRPLTFSCFVPLQVLIVKGSYQRGFLAYSSLGGCLWGYDSYPCYYTLLMLWHRVWNGLNPAHRAPLFLDTLGLNLFILYMSAHFMASSPSRCRPSRLDSGS